MSTLWKPYTLLTITPSKYVYISQLAFGRPAFSVRWACCCWRQSMSEASCKRTQQFPTLLARKCWKLLDSVVSGVQTNTTTPNNVGTSSALCHNIYKLKEFERQYCDTREWSSRRPCVMSGRGTENFWRALQTDPNIVTDQRNVGSCWPNFAQQHAARYNRVCKRTHHVTSNNVGSCWLSMFRPFALCFKCSTVDGTIHFSFLQQYSQNCMGNGKVTVIYRVAAIFRSTLQKIYATKNFGKLSGDRDIQADNNNNNNNFILSTKYKSWIVWPLYTGPLYTGLTEIRQISVEIKFLSGR